MNMVKRLCVVVAGTAIACPLRAEFTQPKHFAVNKGADGVAIGDINNDGQNELIVANRVTRDLNLFRRTDTGDVLELYRTIDSAPRDAPIESLEGGERILHRFLDPKRLRPIRLEP